MVASYLRFDTAGGVDVTGRLNFMLGVGRAARHPVAGHPRAAGGGARASFGRGSRRNARARAGLERRHGRPTCRPAWSARARRPSSARACRWRKPGCASSWGSRWLDALRDLLLDLHGGGLDAGFDQVLRETLAGRDLDRILGTALASAASSDPLAYEEATARIAASGPAFVSVALESQGGGAVPAELVLRDGGGRVTNGTSREVPGALMTALGAPASAARFGWIAALDSPPYAIELAGTASGVVGVSLTLPDPQGGARHATSSPESLSSPAVDTGCSTTRRLRAMLCSRRTRPATACSKLVSP